MNFMKKIKSKKIIIILNIFIILLLLSIIIIQNRQNIIKTARKMLGLETKEITYEIYSNTDNKIKMVMKITDTENGISEIEYPDGDKLTCVGQEKVGIDYCLEKDGTYTFTSKSTTGEIMTETINVDENFRNNLIGIEKIQEIATEQDYKITKKYDGENEYKYYYTIGENNEKWIEIPDYQIVNVDKYKINENNWQDTEGNVTLKVKKVATDGNIVEVHKKITDLPITEDLYNNTEQELEGDSIIACIKDNNIKSGKYTLKVKGEEYPAEIYNYEENVNYITDKNLGTSEEDSRMVIMKYNGNLKVDTDRIITAQTRKKGIFLYVAGDLINNGEISMTARGAKAKGQNVYLWQNDYVPAVGAAGGESVSGRGYTKGKEGEKGKLRQTAGGGSGGFDVAYTSLGGSSGNGAKGTSYSGGTGGGSAGARNNGMESGQPGEENGKAGGYGKTGGTGNPGGEGFSSNGTTGTGGLITIYANNFNNLNGNITSKGTNNTNGGASGGGSINIFYNKLINKGTIEATGGTGENLGGNGGDGSITLQDINIKAPTIEISENKGTSIKINITENNKNLEGITYDYYINDEKKIENTTSLDETIKGLEYETEYKVRVILKYEDNQILSNEILVKTYPKIKNPKVKVNNLSYDKALEYPILTDIGVMNSEVNEATNKGREITVEVSNDENYVNYYSLDGGNTWIKYTGIVQTNYNSYELIKAKSINNNGVESEIIGIERYLFNSSIECTAEDALGSGAYDGNIDTFAGYVKNGTGWSIVSGSGINRYVKVDRSAVGKTLNVNWSDGSSWVTITMQTLDENKNVLTSVQQGNNTTSTSKVNITENTYWIRFVISDRYISHGRVNEMYY